MPVVVTSEGLFEGGDLVAVDFLADVGVVGVFVAFDGLEFAVYLFFEVAFCEVAKVTEFDADAFSVHLLVAYA